MSWQRVYLALGLFGVLLVLACADNSVHILSKYHQLVTSTTLNWLPRSHYDTSREIVIGGIEVDETEDDSHNQAEKSEKKRLLYVCRVLHNTVWVAGTQKGDEKRCTVTIHGTVQSYDKYELLENVDNAARVSWEHWDKYRPTPIGAVATEKMFVARHAVHNKEKAGATPRYTHYIGTLNSNDNLGTISYVRDDETEGSAKSGDVLVETEPISYELTRVKLNWSKKRVLTNEPKLLGEASIINDGPLHGTKAKVFTYDYNYSVYWGQGHAILKGLNTSITLFNGVTLPKVMWGMTEKRNITDAYPLEVHLDFGRGINCTLKANYSDMEVPYTGTLISHYEDGETKSRIISGIRREQSMFDVTLDFGPVYFLNNNSIEPTHTELPTTEATTTATTPAMVVKETHAEDPNDEEDEDDHDENMIIPPKKSDMSNMQSDDGGPLSLKNKVDHSQSGTCLHRLNAFLVPLLMTVVHRIT